MIAPSAAAGERMRHLGRAFWTFIRQRHSSTSDVPAPCEAEFDPASHEIDALFQSTFGEGARVVGLSGVETGDGVTTLAKALSRRCALTNMRAVLVDVSGVYSRDEPQARHIASKDGYDILTIHPNTGELYQTRTQQFLRKLFSETLAE